MYNVRPYMSPCCCCRYMPIYTGHSPMPYPKTIPNPNHFMTRQDYGNQPFVVNINEASQQNQTFRTVLWTGEHLQVTVMSIAPGGDVGLEEHPETDQFLRIEGGEGLVQMGSSEHQVDFEARVGDDSAIFVPAGTWHNLINTGPSPIKLYSIYAPPEHPFGTVHQTQADEMGNG